MSENTITIPADLWGAELGNLRAVAHGLRLDSRRELAHVVDHLADEIERQAPRPEGWYHVKNGSQPRWERIYWWNAASWWRGRYSAIAANGEIVDDATITPVTIGGAS